MEHKSNEDLNLLLQEAMEQDGKGESPFPGLQPTLQPIVEEKVKKLFSSEILTEELEETLKFLELCAQCQNIEATKALSYFYTDEKNPLVDLEKGIRYLKDTYLLGDHSVLVRLATFYLSGNGIEKNTEQAKEYLELGISEGDYPCMALFASCCIDKKDDLTSIDPQELKDSEKLAQRVIEEYDVEKTVKFAETILKNHKELLNFMYHRGVQLLGVIPLSPEGNQQELHDPKTGVALLEILTQYGNMVSPYYLGLYYKSGKNESSNPEKAAVYMQLSLERGFKEAKSPLGQMYYFGNGVEQDLKKAEMLLLEYTKETNQKDSFDYVFSCFILSIIYSKQENFDPDALYYTQESATRGFPPAEFDLGVRYHLGRGVPQDSKEAQRWFGLAAEKGFKQAEDALKKLESEFNL